MPEIILTCPQCERQLRVTEDLLNRLVKCPACGMTFTVRAGSPEQQPQLPPQALPAQPPESAAPSAEGPGAPPPLVYRPPEEYVEEPRQRRARPEPWDYDRPSRERAKSLVLPPAICLLLVGILGMLIDGAMVLVAAATPEMLTKAADDFKIGGPPPEPFQVIVFYGFFALLSLVNIVAVIPMIRMRIYPVAIIGSILPMVTLPSCCCLLGLPLGIWAFVVLVRQDVRAAFG